LPELDDSVTSFRARHHHLILRQLQRFTQLAFAGAPLFCRKLIAFRQRREHVGFPFY